MRLLGLESRAMADPPVAAPALDSRMMQIKHVILKAIGMAVAHSAHLPHVVGLAAEEPVVRPQRRRYRASHVVLTDNAWTWQVHTSKRAHCR